MNVKQIEQIFLDTAYVRMGGRPEELKCAEYLLEKCKEIQKKCEKSGMSAQAKLSSFEVDLAEFSGFLRNGVPLRINVFGDDFAWVKHEKLPSRLMFGDTNWNCAGWLTE